MATLFSSHYGVIRVLLGQKDKSPSSLTLNASINSFEKWFTMNCHLSSPIFPCNLPPVFLPCGLAQRVSKLSLPDVMQAFWWLLALCICSCGGRKKKKKKDSQEIEKDSVLVQTVMLFSFFVLQGTDHTVWSCSLQRHDNAPLPLQLMLHTTELPQKHRVGPWRRVCATFLLSRLHGSPWLDYSSSGFLRAGFLLYHMVEVGINSGVIT